MKKFNLIIRIQISQPSEVSSLEFLAKIFKKLEIQYKTWRFYRATSYLAINAMNTLNKVSSE